MIKNYKQYSLIYGKVLGNVLNPINYLLLLIIFPILFSGCSIFNSDPDTVDFPELAVLMAGAKGTHENLEIECRLGFSIIQVENRPWTHQAVYATMGGEASRAVIGKEDGISFFGNSFDSVKIEFPTPDEIIISSHIHEPKGESRFWEELLRFEGKMTGEQLWKGTWNCFPVDTWEDTVGIIKGTWVIESAD